MEKFDGIINNTLVKKDLKYRIAGFVYVFLSRHAESAFTYFYSYIYFWSAPKFIYDKVNSRMKISRKLITIFMYIIIVLFFTISGIVYIPKVTQQLFDIIGLISTFDLSQVQSKFDINLMNIIPEDQIDAYIRLAENHLLGFVATAGTFSINLLMSFLISFLFLLEKDEIVTFFWTHGTEQSFLPV